MHYTGFEPVDCNFNISSTVMCFGQVVGNRELLYKPSMFIPFQSGMPASHDIHSSVIIGAFQNPSTFGEYL